MADGALNQRAQAIDLKAIAEALGITKRASELRANRDGWPFTEQSVRGGQRRMYDLAALPDEVREAVRRAQAVEAAKAARASKDYQAGQACGRRQVLAEAVDQAARQRTLTTGMAKANGLQGNARARVDAKLDLLSRLDSYIEHLGRGKTVGTQQFCADYAAGKIGTDEIRNAIGASITPISLYRWRTSLEAGGAAALAGAYGNRAGSGLIESNELVLKFALGALASTPHISAKQLWRALHARFKGESFELPCTRSVQRWLESWKAKNHQLFTAIANPDAWKNRYMLAYGNASEDAEYLNDRWEFDSTPGDLELEDGRHNIIGIIDVWSRRPWLHVSKTSSADAVCQALRGALMKWGVPNRAKLDNGRDYVSQRVQRAFTGLGVQVKLSQPFSPWEKPHIERLFNTFSHGLLELLPGYLGHNVAEAQALRASQSFAERLFKKDQTVKLRLTSSELQSFCDRWCESIYQHEPHTGLGGSTVFERVASSTASIRVVEDVRALDVLMAEAPDGHGLRRVGKKGLRIGGLFYGSPELGSLVGEDVRALYDPADMGRVVVYHDEAFICIAECPEVLGISRREVAIEAKARQKTEIEAKRRELKALGRKANMRDIAFEILEARESEQKSLASLPAPNVTHITPHLEAAKAASDALHAMPGQLADLSPLTKRHFEEVRDLLRTDQQQDETEEDRFRRAIRLMDQGASVDEFNARWLDSYRKGSEFAGRWMVFSEWGGKAFGLGTEYDHLSPMLSKDLEKL